MLQQRINGMHMDNGVAIMDPATRGSAPITIEPDVEILPMTFLMGATSIATGSVVGPNSPPYRHYGRGRIARSKKPWLSKLSLMLMLRAALVHICVLARTCAKVPRRVRTWKSRNLPSAKGSKVPHLSYIGDTTMGEGVNIGAGSITCNYDGEKKWPTTIGDNCFVGSDVMMVAPVTLGRTPLSAPGLLSPKTYLRGPLVWVAPVRRIEHWNERKKN